MKYNLSQIMKKPWKIFRKAKWHSMKHCTRGGCQQKLGYKVIHGSKALFDEDLADVKEMGQFIKLGSLGGHREGRWLWHEIPN